MIKHLKLASAKKEGKNELHPIKRKQAWFALWIGFWMIIASCQFNGLTAQAAGAPPTITSVVTDHLGKTITIQFNKAMADPTGKQSQFTVMLEGGAKTITSVALGNNPSQVILNMSAKVGVGSLTIGYTKGNVASADGNLLDNIINQPVTNNCVFNLEMVDYEPSATEIAYLTDSSDPLNPTLKYRFNKLIDYDDVNLAVYFSNGFFRPMVDDINTYVKLYELDTGAPVVLPNILTRPNSPATYTDGSTKNQQIVTDWYFWQIGGHAPLGLNLVSQALKPSTTYVLEIKKGFLFNNNNSAKNTFSFEFTTTANSQTKPSWAVGSSLTTSGLTDTGVTLGWPEAQDNHGLDYNNLHYNIYQNGTILTTVDGSTASYKVVNLTPGTNYNYKVEAIDFADNRSGNLEVSLMTGGVAPVTLSSISVAAPPTKLIYAVGEALDLTGLVGSQACTVMEADK